MESLQLTIYTFGEDSRIFSFFFDFSTQLHYLRGSILVFFIFQQLLLQSSQLYKHSPLYQGQNLLLPPQQHKHHQQIDHGLKKPESLCLSQHSLDDRTNRRQKDVLFGEFN